MVRQLPSWRRRNSAPIPSDLNLMKKEKDDDDAPYYNKYTRRCDTLSSIPSTATETSTSSVDGGSVIMTQEQSICSYPSHYSLMYPPPPRHCKPTVPPPPKRTSTNSTLLLPIKSNSSSKRRSSSTETSSRRSRSMPRSSFHYQRRERICSSTDRSKGRKEIRSTTAEKTSKRTSSSSSGITRRSKSVSASSRVRSHSDKSRIRRYGSNKSKINAFAKSESNIKTEKPKRRRDNDKGKNKSASCSTSITSTTCIPTSRQIEKESSRHARRSPTNNNTSSKRYHHDREKSKNRHTKTNHRSSKSSQTRGVQEQRSRRRARSEDRSCSKVGDYKHSSASASSSHSGGEDSLSLGELWEDNDDCQRRPLPSSKPCKSDELGDKDSAARRSRQDRRKLPKSNSCPIGNIDNEQHEGCTIRRSKSNDAKHHNRSSSQDKRTSATVLSGHPPSKFDSPSSHGLNGLINKSHVSSSSRRSREVLMMTPPPPPPRSQRGTRILQSTPTRRSTGSTSEKDYEPITAAYARVNGIKYTHHLQYTDKIEGFGIYSGPLGKHYLMFCNGHSTP